MRSHELRSHLVSFLLVALALISVPTPGQAVNAGDVLAEVETLARDSDDLPGKIGRKLGARAVRAFRQLSLAGDGGPKSERRVRKARKGLAAFRRKVAKSAKREPQLAFELADLDARALEAIIDLNALLAGQLPPGSALVSTDGGRVSSSDGLVELVAPARSVRGEQILTIEPIDPVVLPSIPGAGGVLAAYGLGPDGASFRNPLRVTLTTGPLSEDAEGGLSAEVGQLHTISAGNIEAVAAQRTVLDLTTRERRLVGELTHFSELVATSSVGQETLRIANLPEEVTVQTRFPVDVEYSDTANSQVRGDVYFRSNLYEPLVWLPDQTALLGRSEPQRPDQFSQRYRYHCTRPTPDALFLARAAFSPFLGDREAIVDLQGHIACRHLVAEPSFVLDLTSHSLSFESGPAIAFVGLPYELPVTIEARNRDGRRISGRIQARVPEASQDRLEADGELELFSFQPDSRSETFRKSVTVTCLQEGTGNIDVFAELDGENMTGQLTVSVECRLLRNVDATAGPNGLWRFAINAPPTPPEFLGVTPTCNIATGTPLPIGVHLVECTWRRGPESTTGRFTVTVLPNGSNPDTTPPEVSQADLTVPAEGADGAVVSFTPAVSDDRDRDPSLVCVPTSGTRFAVGTTPVTCEAADASGNTRSVTFTVTVLPPDPEGVGFFGDYPGAEAIGHVRGGAFGLGDTGMTVAYGEGFAVIDVATGEVATTPAGEPISFFNAFGGGFVDAEAVAHPMDGGDAIIGFGPQTTAENSVNPDTGQLGLWFLSQGGITDVSSFGDSPSTKLVVEFATSSLWRYGYQPDLGYIGWGERAAGPGAFTDASGPPVSAVAQTSVGPILAVTDGTPGEAWLVDPATPDAPGTFVGNVGNDPRRVRCGQDLCHVTNSGSGTVTTIAWDGSFEAEVVGTAVVGAGVLGIDLEMDDGWTTMLTTSPVEDTWSITRFDPAGTVVSTETQPAPEGCDGPGFGLLYEPYVVLSCHDSGVLVRIDRN